MYTEQDIQEARVNAADAYSIFKAAEVSYQRGVATLGDVDDACMEYLDADDNANRIEAAYFEVNQVNHD